MLAWETRAIDGGSTLEVGCAARNDRDAARKVHGPIGMAAGLPSWAPGKPHVLLRWADLCCAICGASEAFYVHESPHVSVYAARR